MPSLTGLIAATFIFVFAAQARAPRIDSLPNESTAQRPASLQTAFDTGFKLLEAQEFAAAVRLLTPAYERARRENNRRFQLALLNSIGTAYIGLHRNRSAITTLVKAAEVAQELDRSDTAAAIAINLSNVYARMGQTDLAYAEAAKAVGRLPPSAPAYYRVLLLLNMAEVKDTAHDRSAAVALCRSALNEARRSGDPQLIADAERRLGWFLMSAGNLVEAESLFTDAITLKLRNKAPGLDAAYRNLGQLRLAQGRGKDAVLLFDKSVAAFEQGRSRLDGWHLYYERGMARRLSADVEGAFGDFQTALDFARRWRAEIVPVDEVLTNADVAVDQLASAYIETGMELYGRHPSTTLAARLFAACEENRAASLRQNRGWLQRLPDRYWDALARLRMLEIAALRSDGKGHSESLRKARTDIEQLETQAGLGITLEAEHYTGRTAIAKFRRHLEGEDALITFYLGAKQSYVWALTTDSFEVHALPARAAVVELARNFRTALLSKGDTRVSGRELYESLFKDLSPRVKQAASWLLSVDDVLFEIPFAALSDDSHYVVERRAVRIIPSAYLLFRPAARPLNPQFLALADPIYNQADARFKPHRVRGEGSRSRQGQGRPSEAGAEDGAGLELSRLPGSSAEALGCARTWAPGPSTVLIGPEARRERLMYELARSPQVLHLSLHVIPVKGSRGPEAYIALGLRPDGTPDFLTPNEIARFKHPLTLVVMSGCSSGMGKAIPGAGLTGLTRAWLLSGSRAVAASLWPTPDDTGGMFRSFYKNLSGLRESLSPRRCADALRVAQLEMLRSRTWRAQPQYWAAFYLMAND